MWFVIMIWMDIKIKYKIHNFHLPSHNPWINVKLNHNILNNKYIFFKTQKIIWNINFVQWLQTTPICNGNSLPICFWVLWERSWVWTILPWLTQSGFAYEGVDWIATWIFFKLIANTIKLVKEWLTKSC